MRREEISVSTSDASTRRSLFRSSPQTFPALRTPRAPRVPPSPTSNSKTSGAGAGDQLRLQQYEVSRSTPVQDAKIPSEGNLRSTKVLRKVGGAAEVPPVSRRRGWRHFRLRLTSYAYVQDGYYRALRRLLYVTTCIESTHKTRYHQKPSSGAVRRRYGTTRWFAVRRHAAFPTHETHTESA